MADVAWNAPVMAPVVLLKLRPDGKAGLAWLGFIMKVPMVELQGTVDVV